MPIYLRTDEELEAAEALSAAHRFAGPIRKDPSNWRWTLIALHNSIQGHMVLSLRHGNGLLALTPKGRTAWLQAYEAQATTYPEERLDGYLSLFAKVTSTSHGTAGGNQRFEPRDTERKSIQQLNTLRNEFIHFTPKGWSLEVSGLPETVMDCLRFIAFLGWETGNIYWHNERAYRLCRAAHEGLLYEMRQVGEAYAST